MKPKKVKPKTEPYATVSDYWGEPHVTISPIGTRLLFGSDWSGSEDGVSVDSYVAELSSYTLENNTEDFTNAIFTIAKNP